MHRGLSVTTVAQTILDLASTVRPEDLRLALAEADYRKLLDLDALDALLGRGKPGSGVVRRALAAHLPDLAHTRSELERRFLEVCVRHRIPLPEMNVHVAGFLVDAVWGGARVVVELDGGAAHGTPAAVKRDRRRDLALRTAGFQVLRYSWDQVTKEELLVAADLDAALRLNNAAP